MKAKAKNAIAVHYLMLLMEEEHMGIIDGTCTDEWPSAITCKIGNMLGDKSCTLRTVGKGVYKGPNPSPLDKPITDR